MEYNGIVLHYSKGGYGLPRNTKKALADSLKDLLRTRPLSKVTIADITEGCGINRMTFYYHFRDIYDLVE